MLFREIIAVYSENHRKHIKTLYNPNAELLKVKLSGTCRHHWALKCNRGNIFWLEQEPIKIIVVYARYNWT
jgi:hypothetical protein